jgi:hypothetical protein
MNCVAIAYDASGKPVGCTEQELTAIIWTQFYTVFALGAGLCLYKSFTADEWADIAITVVWSCISLVTHTKRAFVTYVLPCVNAVIELSLQCVKKYEIDECKDEVEHEDEPCIRVIKHGVETSYTSIYDFVQHIDEHYTNPSDSDGDLVNVDVSETYEKQEEDGAKTKEDGAKTKEDGAKTKEHSETSDSDSDSDSETSSHESFTDLMCRIENHTLQFDFMLSKVHTMQTIMATSPKSEGVHVIKYNGFPVDNGVHFYDRKFVPVDYRMMEIVLSYDGKEYDLNLASPDNFYVAGNTLLDFAFLKWFMLKNHGVQMGSLDGSKCSYVIKCVDHNAGLHTLHPHNYLHVTISGFEVQDSGLV